MYVDVDVSDIDVDTDDVDVGGGRDADVDDEEVSAGVNVGDTGISVNNRGVEEDGASAENADVG